MKVLMKRSMILFTATSGVRIVIEAIRLSIPLVMLKVNMLKEIKVMSPDELGIGIVLLPSLIIFLFYVVTSFIDKD